MPTENPVMLTDRQRTLLSDLLLLESARLHSECRIATERRQYETAHALAERITELAAIAPKLC